MTVTEPEADEHYSPKQRRGFPWSGAHDHTHPVIQAAADSRTLGERVADGVARFGGSWPFIFSFMGLILAWMVVNTVVIDDVLHGKPFDPFPYIALNLVLSALAGLQAPIIMMSQNRAASRDEALAGHHYEESEKIKQLIDTNQSLLQVNTDLTKQIHDLAIQIHGLVDRTGSGSV
jgi:uncharacterized membrane protein